MHPVTQCLGFGLRRGLSAGKEFIGYVDVVYPLKFVSCLAYAVRLDNVNLSPRNGFLRHGVTEPDFSAREAEGCALDLDKIFKVCPVMSFVGQPARFLPGVVIPSIEEGLQGRDFSLRGTEHHLFHSQKQSSAPWFFI